MTFISRFVLTFISLLLLSSAHASLGESQLVDIWGRNLRTRGIRLVDWEGHIANPALLFRVIPPAQARFPVFVELRGNGPRLYFDTPSQVSPGGPRKHLVFDSPDQAISFRLSVFPDRDAFPEDYALQVLSRDADGATNEFEVPIHVIDQDQTRAPEFNLIVDRSQDAAGFFSDPAKLRIAEQAAADWAYFIADMNFDPVQRNAETSFIWAVDGSNSGQWIQNAESYRGFLLYIYGVHGPSLTSGGQGSWDGGLQTSGGVSLNLRRSGTYQAHVLGNYNTLGWFLSTSDDDWLVSANFGGEPNDLYSIAHHEIGHAFFFDGSHPLFAEAKASGKIDDPAVVAYYGGPVVMDNVNHFPWHVDPISGFGAFGNEYNTEMPPRRWLITKLDLLCAQATGYKLRPTTAFEPLRIHGFTNLQAQVGQPFTTGFAGSGGISFYHWDIVSGALPPGVALDSFTGEISGAPTESGFFSFEVRVRDYDPRGFARTVETIMNVAPPALRLQISRHDFSPAIDLVLSGPTGRFARIEVSTDLTDWELFRGAVSIPFQEMIMPESNRFFRALLIEE